jgi:hypothetical protein
MIFIINESVMNGTVTIDSYFTAIEAETFDNAKGTLLNFFDSKKDFIYEIIVNDDKVLSYKIKNKEDNCFIVYGRLKNDKLRFLGDN